SRPPKQATAGTTCPFPWSYLILTRVRLADEEKRLAVAILAKFGNRRLSFPRQQESCELPGCKFPAFPAGNVNRPSRRPGLPHFTDRHWKRDGRRRRASGVQWSPTILKKRKGVREKAGAIRATS